MCRFICVSHLRRRDHQLEPDRAGFFYDTPVPAVRAIAATVTIALSAIAEKTITHEIVGGAELIVETPGLQIISPRVPVEA